MNETEVEIINEECPNCGSTVIHQETHIYRNASNKIVDRVLFCIDCPGPRRAGVDSKIN